MNDGLEDDGRNTIPPELVALVLSNLNEGLDALSERVIRLESHPSLSVLPPASQTDTLETAKKFMEAYMKEAHLYVTAVFAVGYAGLFTLFSALADKLAPSDARLAIALTLVSVSTYIFWTAATALRLSWVAARGQPMRMFQVPPWQRWGWFPVLLICLSTALTAASIVINRLLLDLGFQVCP